MTVTTTDLRRPANRRPARRMTAMLAALTIVLVACSTSPGTDMPNYRTDRPTYQPNSDLTDKVTPQLTKCSRPSRLPDKPRYCPTSLRNS